MIKLRRWGLERFRGIRTLTNVPKASSRYFDIREYRDKEEVGIYVGTSREAGARLQHWIEGRPGEMADWFEAVGRNLRRIEGAQHERARRGTAKAA